jgi:hypothetical protein
MSGSISPWKQCWKLSNETGKSGPAENVSKNQISVPLLPIPRHIYRFHDKFTDYRTLFAALTGDVKD